MITRLCDVENEVDFNRYYQASWVGWHGKQDSPVPVLIGGHIGVNPAGVRILGLRFLGPEGVLGDYESFTYEEVKAHIDFGRPRVGMVKDGPTLVFLSTNTPREPHKGLRPRTLRVHEFNRFELRNWHPVRSRYDERLDWVKSIFNPKFPTIPDALKQLEEGKEVGIPINLTMGLYTIPGSAHPLFAYKRWTVGYVLNAQQVCIYDNYLDYAEEIRRQTGLEVQLI
jgi:hypothetical protein